MPTNLFRYTGYTLSQLFGIARNGSDEEKSSAAQEVAWREWADAYTMSFASPYSILPDGVIIAPITCNPQQGRPKDRQPPNTDPPPPRPIVAGGGGGGSWVPIGNNGDLQLVW
jgi:hypothetical protein